VLEPDPRTRELVLTRLHPGATVEQAKAATGWPLRVRDSLDTTKPPTDTELEVLRALRAGQERHAVG
jgi:glutaconate CoA-transferase subunit B